MANALITGITGFAGSHLAEYLLAEGHTLFGTVRWRSKTDNIHGFKDKVTLLEADLNDSHSMKQVIEESQPDLVFHLAAQSFVPTSWRAPGDTMTTNVVGEVNLFEAIRQSKFDPKIQIACSSEEYGLVHPDEVPIKETNPLRPLSPYGVSKIAQDYLGYQYFESYGMKIVRTRAFNHTGPRRGDVFVTSTFSKQIADIEKKVKEPVIHVGNLEAQRDFTDVRDMVRAYYLAATKATTGEVYNICSGKTWKIQEVLDKLLTLTEEKIDVQEDPKRLRPSDVMILLGDCSKFKKETGWKPEIPFEQTLEDLLNYWRTYEDPGKEFNKK